MENKKVYKRKIILINNKQKGGQKCQKQEVIS